MRILHTLLLLLIASLIYAQSQPGGYTHNWSNYPAGEFGPTVINFDHTGIVPISQVAAVGQHPRIYFNQSDSAEIKNRLDNSLSGQEVMKQVHAYTTLLHLGFSNGGLYQYNASYSLDAFGNRRIDNAGKWDSHEIYYKLKNYDPTALDDAGQTSGVIDNKRRYLLSSVMALEALECYFYYGNTDPDTGLDYVTRAEYLAKAMTYWATLVLNDPDLNPNNYNHIGGVHMAYCYDLNYNFMTTGQQDTVRMALAQVVIGTPRYGSDTEYYATTSNWVGLNTFELLTNFAIEGETGYNTALTEQYMRAYRNFLTYGWYKSGVPYEGMGKNYQFVTALIAAAKRGYSLLGHPHVKAHGKNFMPATLSPYGDSFTGTDVWGGSGWGSEVGGYKFNYSDILGLRYAFQNEADIDFMWRNHIENWYRLGTTGDYAYQQIEPATSGYQNYLFQAAVFCQDYTPGNWETQNAAIQDSLGFLGPERGLAVLKSGHNKDDLMLHFHCRQDMGGHTHGDRNHFTMSSLGRVWGRYTYGSAFQETEYHSCILVNDLGIPIATPDGKKARMPGKFLTYNDEGDNAQVCGDATYAYSWEWHWQSRPPTQDHSWLNTNGWSAVTETWNDFRYEQGAETFHNTPFYNYAHWNNGGNLERMVKRAYNPMDYVYRNILMAREPQPYVIIADDIRKDAGTHNFKWLMQVANDLFESENVVVDNLCDFRNDLILSEVSGENRKLLIRVLESKGTSQLYHETVTPGINGNAPITRVVVEADAVEPEFKILLFPHTDGDALPITSWNANKDSLTISLNGRVNQVLFDETQDHTILDFVAEANVDACGQALCASVDMNIRFDGFPAQTSWEITDATGKILASSGAYSGQSGNSNLSLTPACLPDGCYDLTFYDALNNGMCPFRATATSAGTFITPGTLITPGSVVATLGTVVAPGLCGNYQLYDTNGDLLVSGGGGFGASETSNFCITNGLAALMHTPNHAYARTHEGTDEMTILPNLVEDQLTVRYSLDEMADAQLNIVDINGQVLRQHSCGMNNEISLNVSDLAAGFYFVQIISQEKMMVRKFVKK